MKAEESAVIDRDPVSPTPSVLPPLPQRIIKRDGADVPFDANRITVALTKAGRATGDFGEDEAQLLTQRTLKVLRHRFVGAPPTVEQVQDVVEQMLVDANHTKTFRAYATYRDQRHRLRQDRRTLVDVASSVEEYVDRADWRVPGQCQSGIFAWWPDSECFRQGDSQLLAEPRLFP